MKFRCTLLPTSLHLYSRRCIRFGSICTQQPRTTIICNVQRPSARPTPTGPLPYDQSVWSESSQHPHLQLYPNYYPMKCETSVHSYKRTSYWCRVTETWGNPGQGNFRWQVKRTEGTSSQGTYFCIGVDQLTATSNHKYSIGYLRLSYWLTGGTHLNQAVDCSQLSWQADHIDKAPSTLCQCVYLEGASWHQLKS